MRRNSSAPSCLKSFTIFDKGGWRLSPAYDLVPHPQSSYTRLQGIGVGSQSREATLKNPFSEAARFGLTVRRATQIAELRDREQGWETVFREASLPRGASKLTEPQHLRVRELGGRGNCEEPRTVTCGREAPKPRSRCSLTSPPLWAAEALCAISCLRVRCRRVGHANIHGPVG
jgi:hypothetical protein